VLKRQRDMVELARFNVEYWSMYRDEMLSIIIPRADIRMRESLDRAELLLARAKMAMAIDVNRTRYELEKTKQAREKSLERHAKLLGDRSLMEIKAPADGIVYYGQCVNGSWSEVGSLINKFRPHGSAAPNSVVMTIVQSRPLYVTSTVSEAKRPFVEAGQTARITPPADGSKAIIGRVSSVTTAPVGSNKFRLDLDLEQQDEPAWLVAGVTCKIKVTTYDKPDAVVVPKEALHTDEEDEDKSYAWVVDPDDKDAAPERRDVEIGRQNGKEIEILKGLEKDEVISLEDEKKKDE
jgi:multidrug efflux pump subunit AcrA (membrane-fusion protein)